jgi:hypothetical protein
MLKNKYVELNDINIFVVEIFFIWIRLGFQIFISKSNSESKMNVSTP